MKDFAVYVEAIKDSGRDYVAQFEIRFGKTAQVRTRLCLGQGRGVGAGGWISLWEEAAEDWPNPHLLFDGPHRSKKWDPQAGSGPPVGADQRCLVSILRTALCPCLFLTPLSSASNRDGCLQRGEWAGRVETRS